MAGRTCPLGLVYEVSYSFNSSPSLAVSMLAWHRTGSSTWHLRPITGLLMVTYGDGTTCMFMGLKCRSRTKLHARLRPRIRAHIYICEVCHALTLPCLAVSWNVVSCLLMSCLILLCFVLSFHVSLCLSFIFYRWSKAAAQRPMNQLYSTRWSPWFRISARTSCKAFVRVLQSTSHPKQHRKKETQKEHVHIWKQEDGGDHESTDQPQGMSPAKPSSTLRLM